VQAKDVMTPEVVTVGPDTSAKHAGELMTEHGVAALPVVDGDHRLVGMVAEADVLRTLVRPDRGIRSDVLRLVEAYTGDLGSWDVRFTDGVTTVHRAHGVPEVSSGVEEFALQRLVRTVPGVVAVHVLPAVPVASGAGRRS
jgi:CBS domain-containing protein